MKLKDIIEVSAKMDGNDIPKKGREIHLNWEGMYQLVREMQLSEIVGSFQHKENDRCLNAIASGNFEIASVIAPSYMMGMDLVVNGDCK